MTDLQAELPDQQRALTRVPPQALEARGLTVRYGGVTAVDNVSLRIEPGEIVGLIGPNGAGKSTLIDALSGFVRPTTGTVGLGEHDLTNEPVHRRVHAGLVRSWQSLEVFEDVSVRENLQVSADSHNKSLSLISRRHTSLGPAASTAVNEFELDGDLGRLPGELSFSQRRMVTTARSLALSPSVILLDEPAAGMSDARRQQLAKVIRSLAVDRGMGVLVIDHDMPFVMGICDRIIVLNFGAKIAEGTPAEVRANPAVIAAYLRGDSDEEVSAPGSDAAGAAAPRQSTSRRSDDALLAAHALAVGYYGHPVVRGIDLAVHGGEVVALLGANRAGKTTTLLGLAGAITPLEGDVFWLGDRVDKRVPLNKLAEQGLAFLTEERAVFRQLNVAENLRLGRCDVDKALGMFPELRPMLKRKVGLLSGGEQQMLGLARALAREPKVLLIDEMSLGLAPAMVTRLMDALRAAADEHGVGVVLVEQHVPQALRIADHVCVVAGGRMSLTGTVAEVGHRVDEAFLADVLGTEDHERLDG